MKLSLDTARKLAIHVQGLRETQTLSNDAENIERLIERLGYVQIDTISVIQRAHHHTIWTRVPDYTHDMLHELLANKRRVFEYWSHAACYLPISDYRFYTPRMRHMTTRQSNWFYSEEGKKITDHVLNRIQDEGPLGAADFKSSDDRKRGSWWDWKPAKQALEMLFDMGKLMVTERRKFQRIYDLTERVLPASVDTTVPTKEEMAKFVIRRVLMAKGFSTANEIRWGWNRPEIDQALQELIEAKEVAPIKIESRNEQFYSLSDSLSMVGNKYRTLEHLHLLSPFDGFLDRKRLSWLFNFDYKLECYFPERKRKYGYFCLPILWGNELIGRIDPKADRKKKTLILKTLSFEPNFRDVDAVLPLLTEKLRVFSQFNGCDRIVVEKTCPAKIKDALTDYQMA